MSIRDVCCLESICAKMTKCEMLASSRLCALPHPTCGGNGERDASFYQAMSFCQAESSRCDFVLCTSCTFCNGTRGIIHYTSAWHRSNSSPLFFLVCAVYTENYRCCSWSTFPVDVGVLMPFSWLVKRFWMQHLDGLNSPGVHSTVQDLGDAHGCVWWYVILYDYS